MNSEASLITWNNLNNCGEIFKTKNAVVFFGDESFQMNEIRELIPKHHLMWQVHSNLVIPASSTKVKADGHFTNKSNSALMIKTADCMPVFLEAGDTILGLHIGWRGLAQRILSRSLEHLKDKKNLKLWIGPHVQQETYWLNQKSITELFKYQRMTPQEAARLGILKKSFNKKDQYLISLKDVLLDEAHSMDIKEFVCSDINTYQSHKHFSHRRNPYRVGTNYSFIIKN